MTTRCPPPEDLLRSLLPGERDRAALRAHVAACAECRQIASTLEGEMRRVRGALGGPVSDQSGPDCLSDDTLAAFADGALPADERARAIRHLADCAHCSAAVAALVQALRDPAVRAERQRLEGGRWAGRRTWGVVTAAAAVIALVFIGRYALAPRAAAWDVAALARQAVGDAGVPSAWNDIAWPATRGAGVGSLSVRAAAFRVGMRVVDLRVAIESGNATLTRRWAAELSNVLGAIALADPARAEIAALEAALYANASRDSLRAADLRLESAVRYTGDPTLVNAGAWIEAARLGAMTGKIEVLQSAALRETIERLRTTGVATAQADSAVTLLPRVTPDQLPRISQLLDAIALAAGG